MIDRKACYPIVIVCGIGRGTIHLEGIGRTHAIVREKILRGGWVLNGHDIATLWIKCNTPDNVYNIPITILRKFKIITIMDSTQFIINQRKMEPEYRETNRCTCWYLHVLAIGIHNRHNLSIQSCLEIWMNNVITESEL